MSSKSSPQQFSSSFSIHSPKKVKRIQKLPVLGTIIESQFRYFIEYVTTVQREMNFAKLGVQDIVHPHEHFGGRDACEDI